MRLACYGFVQADAGSVAAGNYVLLETLLARGHEIHLFGEHGFVDPGGLADWPGFHWTGLPTRLATRLLAKDGKTWLALAVVVNIASARLYRPIAKRAVDAAHRQGPFDAVVSLGSPAALTFAAIPTIEWVQGSPKAEAAAFRRCRRMVTEAAGWKRYFAYSALYAVDGVLQKGKSAGANVTICTSDWTRDRLAEDKRTPIRVLPYPFEVERFPICLRPGNGGPTLLHLGRCDPRKRIDLLLDAFRLLRQRFPEAALLVVGREGRIPGTTKRLHAEDLRGGVQYIPHVPRDQVPELFREADVMVQTSEAENFGSSVAEAMLCGVPVVVGPTNGTAQYIDPGSAMFSDYTPEAVVKAILSVLEKNCRNDRVQADRRRAFVLEFLAPDVVAQQFEELVCSVVEDGNAIGHDMGPGKESYGRD